MRAETYRLMLREIFENAGLWRSMMRYDPRNDRAVDAFDRLISTTAFVDREMLLAYAELWEGEADRQAHSQLVEAVGYAFNPSCASDFIARFIADRTGGHKDD